MASFSLPIDSQSQFSKAFTPSQKSGPITPTTSAIAAILMKSIPPAYHMKTLILSLALLTSAAFAQTPCGAHASGKRADGTTWTGSAARMWVDKDGWWRVCQPWVPDGGDPTMPEPKAVPCLGRDTYEEWEEGGRICSSIPPGAYTGNTSRLLYTEDGRARLIRDEWGINQGMALYRCVRGKWVREAAFCKAAQ